MTSLTNVFNCPPFYNGMKELNCPFKSVSPCKDQISQHICNRHANYFGLTYDRASYTNGNNYNTLLIETYVSSQSNLKIPLFLCDNGTVDSVQIRTFVESVKSNYNDVNAVELVSVLSNLLGVYLVQDPLICNSWLNEETSYLIMTINNQARYVGDLPLLHRLLLFHVEPNQTMYHETNEPFTVVRIPNIHLERFNDGTAITMIEPSLVFKKTTDKKCRATPLCIHGFRIKTQSNLETTIKKIPITDLNMQTICGPDQV